jgi:hypothetical protein
MGKLHYSTSTSRRNESSVGELYLCYGNVLNNGTMGSNACESKSVGDASNWSSVS